jgi:mono/diheme cytochrome c family protein
MQWSRLIFIAPVIFSAHLTACGESVGQCDASDKGRERVVVNGMVVYAGQAILNAACATGCHASSAVGKDRQGVPAGLDFDLLPVREEDAAGKRKNGAGDIVVKLRGEQIEGLRARQKNIVDRRDQIWQQIKDKLMPPSGSLESALASIFSIKAKTTCERSKPYSKLAPGAARESLRSWLACGAPLVESNGEVVEKSRAAGVVGYQYPACELEENTTQITLETLFTGPLSTCKSCHPTLSAPNLRSVDDMSASVLMGQAPECGGKPYITPGEPDESYLLDLLKGPNPDCNHSRMPGGGNTLSAKEIQQVADWIEQGAPVDEDDLAPPPADIEDEDAPTDEPTDQPAEEDGEPIDEDGAPNENDGASEPADELDAGAPAPSRDAGKLDAGREAGKADAGKDAGRDAGRR